MKRNISGKKWWKTLACGIAMVAFTGTVGMASDTMIQTKGTFTGAVGLAKDTEVQTKGTFISHGPGHFQLALSEGIKDIHWIDKVLPTDSGHMVGLLLDLDEGVTLMITRRDNVPPKGISQESWNTTWYDKPIQGMTDEEYMAIWRREDPRVSEKYVQLEGGLLSREDMTAARWDRSVQMTADGPKVRFTLDMIMKDDPTHRYVITMDYNDIHKYDLETLKQWIHGFGYLPEQKEKEFAAKGKDLSHAINRALRLEEAFTLPSLLAPDAELSVEDVKRLETLYQQELGKFKNDQSLESVKGQSGELMKGQSTEPMNSQQGKVMKGQPPVRTSETVRITDTGATSQSTWNNDSHTEVTVQRSGQVLLEHK